MGKVLDYATPPPTKKPLFTSLIWTAIISEHLFVFGLYAPALDGGRLMRMCAAVALGYWLIVLLILARRSRHPTKVDLAFVAFGFPVILFPAIFIVTGDLYLW